MKLALLVLYASRSYPETCSSATVAAFSFELVITVCLAVLSLLQHCRSRRPSSIVQIFLSITVLLETVRLRTVWLVAGGDGVAGVQTAAFITKLLLLAVESSNKAAHLVSKGDRTAVNRRPEESAGFFSRALLLWLNPLLHRGYRETLLADHLYELDGELASKDLTELLDRKWKMVKPTRHRRLTIALISAFAQSLLIVQIPRFALVGFSLAQPLMIMAALTYVSHHEVLPVQYGRALVGGFALNYIGVAVSLTFVPVYHQSLVANKSDGHLDIYLMVSALDISTSHQG